MGGIKLHCAKNEARASGRNMGNEGTESLAEATEPNVKVEDLEGHSVVKFLVLRDSDGEPIEQHYSVVFDKKTVVVDLAGSFNNRP